MTKKDKKMKEYQYTFQWIEQIFLESADGYSRVD